MSNIPKLVWDSLISFSLVFIIISLIIEFFFHPEKQVLELLHTIDIFAVSFLLVELAYDFYKAEDKKKFVKKEWILILSFLPFGTIFRLGRIFRSSRLIGYMSKIWGRLSKFLRIEKVGIKTAQSAVHASKVGRITRPIAQIISKKNKQIERKRGRKTK